MLKTKVKVGSVTNLSEARYCAGMGVDFLSFPVSSVDPKMFQDITGWVAGPQFGIEVQSGAEPIDQYTGDFIQTTIEYINQIPNATKLIVAVQASNWSKEKAILTAAKHKILYLEVQDNTPESIISEMSHDFELLIKVTSPLELDRLLTLPVAGISLEGSAEVRAGLKDYPLAEILEKLEVE